jgi:hypothetical protein
MPDPSIAVDDPLLTTEPLEGSYTTAKPRVLNQPGDPILSDEEVDTEIDRYSYYNQEQRAEADQKLADYFEEQHHKLDSQRFEERQRQLLDYDNKEKAAFYATPEVQEAVWLNKDPNKMWAKHVITGVLRDKLKRPLVEGEYEGAKNKIIAPFAGVAAIDDTSALSVLTKGGGRGRDARITGIYQRHCDGGSLTASLSTSHSWRETPGMRRERNTPMRRREGRMILRRETVLPITMQPKRALAKTGRRWRPCSHM